MRIITGIVGLLFVAATAMAQNAPQGAPPIFRVVANTDKDKGQVFFIYRINQVIPVTVQRLVNVNGQQEVQTVTEYKTVTEERIVVQDLARSRVITPDGKQLPIDEVWTRLQKNAVVAVSSDGHTPDPAYLRALHPQTLIIIAPPPPPAPPQPPK